MREEISARRTSSDASTSPSFSRERNDVGWELGELDKMVRRRLKGEPLQYILGGYRSTFPRRNLAQLHKGCSGPVVPETGKTCVKLSLPSLLLDRGGLITDLKHGFIHTGNQPFGPIAIKTRAPILIPRPETEDWTIRLTSLLEDRFSTKDGREGRVLRMLDLCTGTGCIPILVCHLRRQSGGTAIAYGVDISTNAVSLARENASDQSLTPSSGLGCHDGDPEASAEVEITGEFGGRTNQYRGTVDPIGTNATDDGRGSTLDVIRADILGEDFVQLVLSRMDPPFDVITSNPPYIPLDEYEKLPNSVKEWEDRRALLGDPPTPGSEDASPKGRGLAFYHRIAEIVSTDGILGDDGVVALEVGANQAERVREILKGCGNVSATEVWKDPWGVPRVVVGYRQRGRDTGPLA